MNKVKSVYILDSVGNTVFMRERIAQGDSNVNHLMLSKLVTALQQFAKEYGENETRVIKMDGYVIYSIKDQMSNYVYCLICALETKQKEMFKKLNEIMNLYIDSFLGITITSEIKRQEILHSFGEKVDDILEQKKKIHEFLKSM
jgi:hypothetical protein